MAEFPKNPQRLTPYPNFRFKMKWDGNYIAGVSKVSGLSHEVNVMKKRVDRDPPLVSGQTSFEAITLERGVSYDPAFMQWANKVFECTNSPEKAVQDTSLADSRKNMCIEAYSEAGQKV